MKIKVTLTEELLGTLPKDREVFATYIASKAPSDNSRRQEIETAEHKEESGTTGFHKNEEGYLIMWDYEFKGFLKEAADVRRQSYEGEKKSSPWGTAKGKFDRFVFVFPRKISLGRKEPDGICERPLLGMTAQGPRVTLARSEVISAGTSFECEIFLLPGAPVTEEMIRTCLDYGALKGLGQWRNSGKGRFTWEELKDN